MYMMHYQILQTNQSGAGVRHLPPIGFGKSSSEPLLSSCPEGLRDSCYHLFQD